MTLDNFAMLLEILRFIWESFLKLIGIGFKGIGEFEEGEEFRRKINLRIQKEKDDGLPLLEGKLVDVFNILLCISERVLNIYFRFIKLRKK